MVNPVRICAIASEVAPFAKTGGLADVTAALTKYLHAQGHDVRLFMPLYSAIDRNRFAVTPVPGLSACVAGCGKTSPTTPRPRPTTASSPKRATPRRRRR